MTNHIGDLKGKIIEDRFYDYDDLLTRLYTVSIGIGEDWLHPYDLSFLWKEGVQVAIRIHFGVFEQGRNSFRTQGGSSLALFHGRPLPLLQVV